MSEPSPDTPAPAATDPAPPSEEPGTTPETDSDPGSALRPVVAIVPAKDAAASVGATVAALTSLPEVDEIVVVDDGSSDATADAARAAGAWVLQLPANRGKGEAVAAGVNLASHAGTYLLIDADTGSSAAAARVLLTCVLDHEADMAVGVLPSAAGQGGFGLVRDLAGAGIRRATGRPVTAPLSGQRAVRGDLLRSVELAPRFGLEVGMTIDARRTGARVVEVPVAMEHRHTGRTVSGFAHRARQGADVVRALWPRLTSRRARIRLIAVALLAVVAASFWSGGRWEASSVAPPTRPDRVLIVSISGLEWDEVGTGRLPHLDRLLAGGGALGAMTVRTLSSDPSPVEAYATLGAGARVRAGAPGKDAAGVPGGAVVVPAAATVRRDAGRHVPSTPGALGDAMHRAGLRTAVVGNADTATGLTGLERVPETDRPAPVALMDSEGRVDAGSVDPHDLLMADRPAPFSRRADPERVLARTVEALATADVVLVDPGDLDRVRDLAAIAPEDFVARLRDQALTHTDELLGRLVAAAPPGTLVLAASFVPPADEWRLTPIVAGGTGTVAGYLHSPSTRRLGLVALTDLAPTLLQALDVPVPAEMVGHALRFHPATPDPGRLGRLDTDIAYRERIYLGVALGFIVFQAIAYAVVVLALARGWDGSSTWRTVLRDVALAGAAFPLATLLFRGLTPFAPRLGPAGVVLLVACGALVVVLARRARRHLLSPLAWIYGATAWLLLADVATGGRLQVGGILGYSPQSAGRFFGLGNTTFAVLAAVSLLGVALHLHHAPRRREALAASAAFLVLVVVVDGAPGLGDDVGGILTLVPVFGLTLLALTGRKLTWRLVGGAAAVTLAVLALAVTVDLLRPPEARSHLGRLVADTWSDGRGELGTTIARKAEANVRLLLRTPWVWAVPLIAGFLLYLLVVKRRWADLLPPRSALRTGVVAAVAAGVVGFATNDSGVVVTALVLVEVGPLLTLLALGGDRRRPVLLEPTGPSPAGVGGPSAADRLPLASTSTLSPPGRS
ncbi:MAG: glycosyltransferase [Actinomycetota bacterium]|nr:glycosyltransferase [Actinomycetota bacterium]